MSRSRLRFSLVSFCGLIGLLAPFVSSEQEPKDLKIGLRSATGNSRFQLGEIIPLEVSLSSSAPGRYLEPCLLFVDTHFGSPECRFFNDWTFTISPEDGWVDLYKEFPSGDF